MPWHCMAKKDAVNCENPRGAVSKLRSGGIRMGQPVPGYSGTLRTYFISEYNKDEGIK